MARPRKTAAELAASGAKPGRVAKRLAEERGIGAPSLPPRPVLTLDAFDKTVARERTSYSHRLVPGQTVCLDLDGKEFTRPENHPLTIMLKYAIGMTNGSLIAGSLAKRACQHFLDDYKHGAEREIFLDPVAIQNIHTWFTEFSEEGFVLQPWELFVVGNLLGWKKLNGTRRFRECWLEVAKKSGKTALAEMLALFLITCDQEPHAEVYTLANTRQQANLNFKAALRQRESNSQLRENIQAFRSSLLYNGSLFQVCSSETKGSDGPIPSGLFFDECHEFSSDELYVKWTQGRVSRSQPLIFNSTTAGNRPESFAGQRHQFFVNLLLGVFEDDSKFAFICCLDEGDDYKDERNWYKASPNLSVTVRIETLREMVAEIENYPANLTGFLRYMCNLWMTPQENHSLPPEKVTACKGLKSNLSPWDLRLWFIENYGTQRCFGGFDYGEVSDMCCFTLLFPLVMFPGEEKAKTVSLPWYFIPADEVPKKEKLWRVPLTQWIREGWITTLPGNIADPGEIRPYLVDIYDRFRVRDTGYDRWGGIRTMMASLIEEHIAQTTEVPQHAGFLTSPSKEFKLAVLNGTFAHLGNPVLQWNMLNISLEIDEKTSSMVPRKAGGNKNKKIDGCQATITAWARYMDKDSNPVSVYQDRGIVMI